MKDTIRSSREIDVMFRTATRRSDELLVVLAKRPTEGRGPSGRVACIAGRKTGNAVNRSRAKRVLREAVIRAGGPWPGWDVALVATAATAGAGAAVLDASLGRHLGALGVMNGEHRA